MLSWLDILKFANFGNPKPDQRVEKSDEAWMALLTPEQYQITRQKGTERAHSSDLCNLFEPGRYACLCCGTALFDSEEKFQSGTGWPSFTQPIQENAIAYHKDRGAGMYRIEAVCNTCDAHLGHVFQDGPPPGGLRYCINAVALEKVHSSIRKATLGGGCFWCTEALFQELKGVHKVESGYSGGHARKPTYREVCSGLTGHAEGVEITYDSELIAYADILRIHLSTHDPTTLNRQGADKGTQYRSIIFYRNETEKQAAKEVIKDMQPSFDSPIITELKAFEAFYKADADHQNYYRDNPEQAYCQAVINPKLQQFRTLYGERMK